MIRSSCRRISVAPSTEKWRADTCSPQPGEHKRGWIQAIFLVNAAKTPTAPSSGALWLLSYLKPRSSNDGMMLRAVMSCIISGPVIFTIAIARHCSIDHTPERPSSSNAIPSAEEQNYHTSLHTLPWGKSRSAFVLWLNRGLWSSGFG